MSVLREIKRRVAAAKAAFIEPSLPTLAQKPPAGARWLHEIKHDGYRLQARRDADGIALIRRNGFDWATRYPVIAADLKALACRSCIRDGEVVILDVDGAIPVFDRLRHGPRVKSEAVLYAFDLLELDGVDLRAEPIEFRKAELDRLLVKRVASGRGKSRPPQAIYLVEHLDFDDADMVFEQACGIGCEGIVSKLKGSRYTSGRTRDWIKVKNPNAPWAKRLEDEDWNDDRKRSSRT
jgi:ATP-dependent DNA ligase